MHPQGWYLAVLNKYMDKKKEKYSVELFETKDMKIEEIPNQKILIKDSQTNVEREILQVHSVEWEPNYSKIAIHSTCRKVIAHGEANFSNVDKRHLVDVYQIKSSPAQGFQVKNVGTLPSEKVQDVFFSGSGNLLCTVDNDFNKTHLIFYMISKISNEGQIATTQRVDHKKKLQTNVRDQASNLSAVDDTYEFQKIARHEVRERKWIARWDQSGRFFMIQGLRL